VRVLVTGGAGRLGRSVVASLVASGHGVVSLDREQRDDLAAEQLAVDLADARATAAAFDRVRPDAVVHLAAIADPFSRPELEIYLTNTTLMANVLDATLRSGTGALLVASSPTVIGYGRPAGWTPSYLPLDEGHPLEPWHGYAAAKEAIEKLVAMAARRHGDAAQFGVFRPCYVIAPEEWQGAPTQQGHTVAERLADPALAAPALFNYLDARDAGDFVLAWLAAVGGPPNGACYFVGAADALATAPLSELLPRYLPGLATVDSPAAALTGTAPAFDCSLAGRHLGWTAKRSWRTELARH